MRLRHLLTLCLLAAGIGGVALAQESSLAPEEERPTEMFDRAILVARAADLAKQQHVRSVLPEREQRRALTYDEYRAIRFQPENAIWLRENRSFAVDLFYPGFIFDTPVNINLVVGRTARRVLFKNELFDYDVPISDSGDHTAYSGFRVRTWLNTPEY